MSNTNPIITIGIPNYNYGHFIGETIESVLSQSFTDYEILIYDDGSTDDSVDIIRKNFGKYVSVIEGKVNKGLGVARNRLIEYARGKYILFLDSDDKLAPGALEALVDAIPGKDAVIAKVKSFSEDPNIVPQRHRYINETIDKLKNKYDIYTLAQLPCAWNRLMSVTFLRENRIRFSEIRINEDVLFGYLFAFSKPRVCFLDKVILYLRQHPYSLQAMGDNFDKKVKDFIAVTNELGECLRKQNLSVRLKLLGNYLVYKILCHKDNPKLFETIVKYKKELPVFDRTVIAFKLLCLSKSLKYIKII